MIRVVQVQKRPRGATQRCPFCHGGLRRRTAVWTCPRCGTPHHFECARENKCCTIMGCRHAFALWPATPVLDIRQGPRGAPRRDFWIGCTMLSIALVPVMLVAIEVEPIAGIAVALIETFIPILPIAVITIVWALSRALDEGRWST